MARSIPADYESQSLRFALTSFLWRQAKVMAGLVLLVAMIGAIVLTLKHRTDIKRQNIGRQVARSPETAISIVNPKPGQGL